jgi:hypothetical protein
MANKNLLKDFKTLLDERGYEIANEMDITQETPDEYSFAPTIYKNREVLVPFLCKMAVGLNSLDNNEQPICYDVPIRKDLSIVRKYILGLLKQFLENLAEKQLVVKWTIEKGFRIKVLLTEDEHKRRFFRSEWAELVFRHIIMNTVHTFCNLHKISHKVFNNVKFKNKDEFDLYSELDLVVQIQERFYVFEVKSGPKINIMQWARRENALVDKTGLVRNIVCTIYDNIPAYIFEPQLLLNLSNIKTGLNKILAEDFTE